MPDICTAPDCGAFIPDDAKPCPVCEGRGFNQSLKPGRRKAPWDNAQWKKWRAAQVSQLLKPAGGEGV